MAISIAETFGFSPLFFGATRETLWRSAVAHMKHLFGTLPEVGQEVAISYSQQAARVQDIPARTPEKELAR